MHVQVKKLTGRNIFKLACTMLSVVVLALAGYFFVKNMHTVHADGIDWTSQDSSAAIDSTRDIHDSTAYYGGSLPVQESVFLGNSTTQTTMEVHEGKNFRLAYGGNPAKTYVGLNGDYHMYVVDDWNLSNTGLIMMSNESNNLVYGSYFMISNLPSHLTPIQVSGVTHFTLDSSAVISFHDDNNNPLNLAGIHMSSNGQWAVLDAAHYGPNVHTGVRINLDDSTTTLFETGLPGNVGNMAISNDGRFAVIGTAGAGVSPVVFNVDTDHCGVMASGYKSEWLSNTYSYTQCSSRDLYFALNSSLGVNNANWATPQFIDDQGGQLEVVVHSTAGTSVNAWVMFTATGFTPAQQLDYLALGDSYSSGEGDLNTDQFGNDYYEYRTHDDGTPKEVCHLSTESYPFKLALGGATIGQMKSVACSGAETSDITGFSRNYEVDGGYFGQPNSSPLLSQDLPPRLRGLANRAALQDDALTSFIPGRIQQINFVKEYRPKILTITIGGNDVDFKGKVEACVLTNAIGCIWSTDIGKGLLANELRNEYTKLVSTYSALHAASPATRIYVLGYPQFVDATGLDCGTNLLLGGSSRQMVHEAVTYFNQIIKAAAAVSGAYYVDIENSLGGHTLCGSDAPSDVNGFADAIVRDASAAFHPNANGHALIAQSIMNALGGATLEGFNECTSTVIVCPQTSPATIPDPTAYFENLSIVNGIVEHVNEVTDNSGRAVGVIKKGIQALINSTSLPLKLMPDTEVKVVVHSDPVTLDDTTTDSTGNFGSTITIPDDLPVGLHTVEVDATSNTNQPVTYYQSIYVAGPNDYDINDNGIYDYQESCISVPPSGVDSDLDGIDDACDPSVSGAPQLYRVVRGNSTRAYNGGLQNPNYLYIERNIHATAVTGITGDSDGDGDGWAIVGVSQGRPYTDTSVPDTTPVANFKVIGTGTDAVPYLYLRAGGYGCVAYTPTSLAPVLDGQIRTIKVVEYNTDKCRQEDPSADDDGDGQPDNIEPLYKARAGDPTVQHTRPDGTTFYENPSKTYLFRNFYASEAQLGVSDYSPTGTSAGNGDQPIQTWNLLASSQDSTMPAYNKLVMLTDSNGKPIPTVLTKKQNGQCVAYQPSSTDIIKMNTQYSRGFTKLTSLPVGVNCA